MDLHLERPGATIAYSASAAPDAARAVVVTHALATSRAWEDAAGILDWSAVGRAGSRLVRYDTRGHGASTGDGETGHYTWPFLAEDLLAVADAVSPGRPVDGLGESTGCGTLLWAVLTAPERFRRLALVIPPTRGPARAEQAELYTAAAEMVEVLGIDSWRRMIDAAVPVPILEEGGWARTTGSGVRDELLPAVLRGAAASTFPDDEALGRIRQPTLILAWDTDPSHPLETAEHLAGVLPNSTLETAATPDVIRSWGAHVAEFLGSE